MYTSNSTLECKHASRQLAATALQAAGCQCSPCVDTCSHWLRVHCWAWHWDTDLQNVGCLPQLNHSSAPQWPADIDWSWYKTTVLGASDGDTRFPDQGSWCDSPLHIDSFDKCSYDNAFKLFKWHLKAIQGALNDHFQFWVLYQPSFWAKSMAQISTIRKVNGSDVNHQTMGRAAANVMHGSPLYPPKTWNRSRTACYLASDASMTRSNSVQECNGLFADPLTSIMEVGLSRA